MTIWLVGMSFAKNFITTRASLFNVKRMHQARRASGAVNLARLFKAGNRKQSKAASR
jgi:hypothetical protein